MHCVDAWTKFLKLHVLLGASLISGLEYGMENGITVNVSQLQLTRVTDAAQSTSEVLWASSTLPTIMLLYPSMVLVLLQAHHQVLLIVLLQSQTLVRKAKVWLHETIVMELFSWPTIRWQELVLDPRLFASIFICAPRSFLDLSRSLNGSKRSPHALYCS